MPQPNVLILRAPGTNCDEETAYAFQRAGAATEILHINRLLEKPDLFDRFQVLCLPGGFSYGDDVAAGRILGNQIRHHLADAMARFKDEGRLILGICNGFQVLLKSGVLLEPGDDGPEATLTWNDSGRFEDRWVRLGVDGRKSVFLGGIESIYLPVAHAEGKFVTRDEDVLQHLDTAGRLTLRYRPLAREQAVAANGHVPYPDNPNGSWGNTAGICDATGRVLGMMPHPERHIDRTHHPRWTRGEGTNPGQGLRIFRNAVEFFS